jgi:hypothetical protein
LDFLQEFNVITLDFTEFNFFIEFSCIEITSFDEIFDSALANGLGQLYYKQLEKGTFELLGSGKMGGLELSWSELSMLLDGIELGSIKRRKRYIHLIIIFEIKHTICFIFLFLIFFN